MNVITHFAQRVAAICLASSLAAATATAAPLDIPHVVSLNHYFGGLQRFDARTGAYIDTIGDLPLERSELNIGPDGNFYVTIFSYSDAFKIMRVDARTGATTQFIDGSQRGGIRGMDFGPNGNLFVAAGNGILEFNGQTGQYIRNFFPGIAAAIDLDFAPDGSLYVARGHHQISDPSSILHIDGTTGALIRTFATTQVDTPQNIRVGPTGDVFVTNQWSNASPLVRFDGQTGAVKFAVSGGLSNPQGMAFGINGELLVASWDSSIKRFDPETGAFLGNFAQGNGFILDDPLGVIFVPEPSSLLMLSTLGLVRMRCRRTGAAKH